MISFLEEVVDDFINKNVDFSELTFILPSKRAGVFLSHILAKRLNKTIFAPSIVSIEEFVETLSDLEYATNIELIFEFYEVYCSITPDDQIESFQSFSKWAQLLIQDFNEIDRYLIPPDSIFDYLKSIKELNHWSISEPQNDSVKNYLSFWNRLKVYYYQFRDHLIQNKKGYQGLVYREAVENLEHYLSSTEISKYVFVGFNALNKSEEIIIQELLKQGLASIYWDIDQTFISNELHDASLFIRSHQQKWSYFEKNQFNWISSNYELEKQIKLIGIPKNIGQAKHIGEILSLLQTSNHSLQNTAVVLGDENLLLPLLNSIPKEVAAVNITMGLPLKSIPLASLFEELFKLHKHESNTFYYKDVDFILSHQFVQGLFQDGSVNYSNSILNYIQSNNIVYISYEKLKSLSGGKKYLVDTLFNLWKDDVDIAIKNCSDLIFYLKEHLSDQKSKNLLALEYLYRFHEIFNELSSLHQSYQRLDGIQSLLGLYKELLKTETLDFKGEPLHGLQIMGMLESRVLDFETVIISSVNEGILPAGKGNNSFIPFDVKIENGLPTYKEKDAVYTYHFYRLLQRAKNVYILYNTEPDVLNGGEKSRFITQLQMEKLHIIEDYVVSPKVPAIIKTPKKVAKTDAVLHVIKSIASNGFSPSSLTNYVRNPFDFYKEKILGVKSFEEVEETVAANTLGNVIHESLESFYSPLKNKFLQVDHLTGMKDSTNETVEFHFKKHYKEGDISKGKNLIIFEIAKRYIHNFLNKEIELLTLGHTIKILDVEKKIKVPLLVPEINFPIYLKGTVDRIDERDGVMRIIDYKTGKVDQNKVEVINWADILTDYDKYSKSFQVLCYAYMLNQIEPFEGNVEGGIISFKNLKGEPFLKFTKKDKPGRGSEKNSIINDEILNEFSIQLKLLILEICNPEIDFVEKFLD